MSLDCLGAGEGLGTKYITLRVKRVDVERLRQKLGGATGAAMPAAMALVDQAPEVALHTAMPYATKKAMDDYGVELEWQVTDAPLKPGQKTQSKFGVGIISGGAIAVGSWFAWKWLRA